jgi:hypothetical protein
VTFEGSINITGMVPGQVSMIGLLDAGALAAGMTGFQAGAYLYVHRNGDTFRIGPSDGNAGGEIIQTSVIIPLGDVPASGDVLITMTIDGTADPSSCASGSVGAAPTGCIQVTIGGVTGGPFYLQDSYGGVGGYANEFAGGAHPGWDDYLGSLLAYDFVVSPAEIVPEGVPPTVSNLAVSPNPIGIGGTYSLTALVDDILTGGSSIASATASGACGGGMLASDGDFNSLAEDVIKDDCEAPQGAGIHELEYCVSATDNAENTSEPVCETISLVVYDPSAGFVTGGGWIWSDRGDLVAGYNSIPEEYPGSFPSLGYEATSTDEFGDHIAFAGVARDLQTVTVSLTNWACENDFDLVNGAWEPNRLAGDACVSTPGSGYEHPIRLNIYEVDDSGADPAVGSLIHSVEKDFFIPFRPSHDPQCPSPATDVPFGGTWYDPVLGSCVHGFAFDIQFDLSAAGIVLPDEVVFGVEYNTADHGDDQIGEVGPYNSLNVSLTAEGPLVGTDVETGTAFWDTSYGPFYCDGGAGGTDTFRRDADCWAPYTPVVRFDMLADGAYKPDATAEGKASFGFVSRYKKGASTPDGATQFYFEAGNLDFFSDVQDWLVVNQAGTNAQFKGEGLVNGVTAAKFMLWAGDGTGDNGEDTFRIKIWEEIAGEEFVIYDNGTDQAISGGSIVIHTGGKGKAGKDGFSDVPVEFALGQNYPNPFNPATQLAFDLPEASNVRLAVFDVLGRQVALLADGGFEAGTHEVTWNAESMPSGVYLYRIEAGAWSSTRRMMLLK